MFTIIIDKCEKNEYNIKYENEVIIDDCKILEKNWIINFNNCMSF